jgi:hypothetical protein
MKNYFEKFGVNLLAKVTLDVFAANTAPAENENLVI